MNLLLTVSGAVLPSILLLWYFYKKDLNPEPVKVLRGTFLRGVMIVFPVLVLAQFLENFAPQQAGPLVGGFFNAFFLAAIPEELFKYLVIVKYSAADPAFDEPMDGIVYGATASLGFATLENIMYVADGGLGAAIIRAITAVPSHACLGAIIGYYVGQARFNMSHTKPIWWGLWIAMLLHGLYDFPLMVMNQAAKLAEQGDLSAIESMPGGLLLLLFVGVIVVEFVWTVKVVRKLRREQLSLSKAS